MTNCCPAQVRKRLSGGFTMVELLVSIAVIALIVTMINRLVGSISQAVTTNTKQLDAAAQARLVFDRLGMDLSARPRRTDLGVAFTKGGNNDSDSIAFYSTVTGYNLVGSGSNGTRDFSVVSYRIQNSAERVYQLERGASAPDYTAGTGPFQTPAQPPTLPVKANYDVLAPGVFRLAYRFLLTSGSLSNTLPNNDLNQASAVVVALAVLDDKSRLLLSNPGTQLQELAKAFPDGDETVTPASAWNAKLNQTGGFSISDIPKQATQCVRIYQRTFYVP